MVPSNASIVAWDSWSSMLIKKRDAEKPSFGTVWPNEIENVLLLLLFLPLMNPNTVFGSAVGKFIWFHKVSEETYFLLI